MIATFQNYLSALLSGSSTQFLKALRDGDTKLAMELYKSKANLREKLEPNLSLGPEHKGYTYLHYAALYGLEQMYEELVLRQNGKPDIKNSLSQNCLHLLCMVDRQCGDVDISWKRKLLAFTLRYGLKGMDLQHILGEKDQVSPQFSG